MTRCVYTVSTVLAVLTETETIIDKLLKYIDFSFGSHRHTETVVDGLDLMRNRVTPTRLVRLKLVVLVLIKHTFDTDSSFSGSHADLLHAECD